MTNPSPRPALRKAADADVHPAAPRPARSPRARTAPAAPVHDARPTPAAEAVKVEPAVSATAPLKPAKKRHPEARKPARPTKRKFSGSTSDHLRVPEVPEVTSSQRSALDHLFENDAALPAKPKAKKEKAPKPVDLMAGKPVDLGASVPKALRKAARDKAKEAGLDVDTVVTDLLHAWVTGRS